MPEDHYNPENCAYGYAQTQCLKKGPELTKQKWLE